MNTRNKNYTGNCLVGLVGFGLFACSQGVDYEEGDAGIASESSESLASKGRSPTDLDMLAEAVEVETLHELNAGSDKVTWYRAYRPNGDTLVFLSVSSPVVVQLGTMARLRKQEANLTLLEVFYALSPAGSEADPALVAFHEEETKQQGRVDALVRTFEFDVNEPIEKSAASDCTQWAQQAAEADAEANDESVHYEGTVGNGLLCPTGDCTELRDSAQWIGVCVHPGATRVVTTWWRYEGDGWNSSLGVIIPGGNTYSMYFPSQFFLLDNRIVALEVSHSGSGVPFPAPFSGRGWVGFL